ncbi:MAG: hypothetical protein ACR2MX_08285 [Cyclobacteriaceae bacterium]
MKEPAKPKKKLDMKPKKKIKKIDDSPEDGLNHQQDFGGLPERDLKKGLGCGG